LRIYVASKAKHNHFWRALRAAGVPIVASWIDADINRENATPTPSDWSAHWEKCIAEAASATRFTQPPRLAPVPSLAEWDVGSRCLGRGGFAEARRHAAGRYTRQALG
jgi:hypothetical protein